MKGRYQGFSLDNASNSAYSYDGYGRLNGINGFTYSRLANSELIENITRPNGANTAWAYETHRNLVAQVANDTASTFGYVNDKIGRRVSMSRSGSAFATPDVITYDYNDRSEIISAVSHNNPGYNYSYNYDPIGNRQAANLNSTAWTYTSNNLNQYTAVNSDAPSYDADGNMLANGAWSYTWNGENRMIAAVNGDTRLKFAYDYMGRRVEKKVYGGETLSKHTKFVYDGYKLVEELDALNSNAVLRKYTWQPDALGIDVPLTVKQDGATYYYHTDANKNVSELTDSTGAVVAHYEYSPFGQLVKVEGSYAEENPFRFSSEYYDSETGLIYYNYRYYSPDLGRWTSRDPIEELGGYNLYNMVDNSPADLWDDVGLRHVCSGFTDILDWLAGVFSKGKSAKDGIDKIDSTGETGKNIGTAADPTASTGDKARAVGTELSKQVEKSALLIPSV